MRLPRTVLPLLLASSGISQIQLPVMPREPFLKQVLTTEVFAEGMTSGDFDRDGITDLASGPFWWQGPTFAVRHEIRPPRALPIDQYSDCFLEFAYDFDGDRWDDLLVIGFPGADASWFRNPRRTGVHWQRFLVWPQVGIESPAFQDLDRDGKPELVCSTANFLIRLTPDPADPRLPWIPHVLLPIGGFGVFTHGLGVGDVNGDGRLDVMLQVGWLEQPPSLTGDPAWIAHPFSFGAGQGGGQMFAYDVDADGDNDVVTSINAHGYGLSWFEHVKAGTQITFVEHVVQKPVKDPSDPHQFSQLHALALADVDGDGLLDIVTGKRFWAHLGIDPGERDPVVLYWFRLVHQGGVRFEPRLIDNDTGVGLQVLVQDLDGDGVPEIAVGNKRGTAVIRQNR